MKTNNKNCMDELFQGLINPNIPSSNAPIAEELSPPVVESIINDRMQMSQPSPASPSSNIVKEKKKPGRKKTNKVSFMARLSEDKMEKLNWLAARFGIHKCDIIEEGLSYYLSKYEEKHGAINPATQQTAADLIQ